MVKRLRLVFSAFIGLLLLIYLVKAVFNFPGTLFYLELLGTLVLTILIVFGLIFSQERAGPRILFKAGVFSTLNFFLLWLYAGREIPLLLLLSVALLLFNLPFPAPTKKKVVSSDAGMSTAAAFSEADHSIVLDAPEMKASAKGKFVASKRGKFYHKAGSDWALKIKSENQVWFDTKKDAQAKGYKEFKEK